MRTATAIVALLALVVPGPQSPNVHVLNAHFKPGGPRYEYVAFELSPGVEAVTITYSYSGDDGSSVIDLGLFEPGPLTIGTPAFRGYSGGAQRTITVGRNTASPGYEAGPLPAGLWHVMLGIYKVAPAGVDVTDHGHGGAEEPSPAPRRVQSSLPATAAVCSARALRRRNGTAAPFTSTPSTATAS